MSARRRDTLRWRCQGAGGYPLRSRKADRLRVAAEVELKFAITPEAAARLGRLPPVRAVAHGRAVSRALHSVYYDTPEFDLHRERISLRLRQERGEWVQTLKSAPDNAGGLHQRQELDTPVPGRFLNHAALVGSGVSRLFVDAERLTRLEPVFETDFRRTTRLLDLGPGSRAELAVDQGSIRAGERCAPISEIEIELESGVPKDLVDFALTLLDHADLRLEPATKAQRGYALAIGAPPPPAHAETPRVGRHMTLGEAFHCIVSECVRHLLENGHGLLRSDDVEYLHQARVAIRRLRLAFRLFRRVLPLEPFGPSLATVGWLAEDLGRARDWDVFVFETLPRVASDLHQDSGLGRLTAWADGERAAANRLAREDVASKRYTRLLLELTGAMLQGQEACEAAAPAPSLAVFAADAMKRRHRQLVRRGRDHGSLDAAGLHALRRQIKKLRYTAAFFSSLWPKKPVNAYLSVLADLQTLLGSVNDAVVAERLVGGWRQSELSPGDYETIGLVRGWSQARASAEMVQFRAAWKAFRNVKKFWRLAPS